MMSISIGPLALPLAPVVLLLSLVVAAALARWRVQRAGFEEQARAAGDTVWFAAFLGLSAARLAFVLQHFGAYAGTPVAMLDIRDGGWNSWVGFAVAAAWLIWRGWQQRQQPSFGKAWAAAAVCVLAAWGVAQALWLTPRGQPMPDLVFQPLPDAVAAVAPAAQLQQGAQTQPLAAQNLKQAAAGRPAVVNLWATWCAPCRAEMPMLAAAQAREPDIAFLFVNQGEAAAQVHRYLLTLPEPLREVWLDPQSALGPAVGSAGLPTTLFYDAQGNQVGAHFGILSAPALQARLRTLR